RVPPPHGTRRCTRPPGGAHARRPRRRPERRGRAHRPRGAPAGGRPMSVGATPQQVAAATLLCLPSMTPVRFRALLAPFGAPVEPLAAVRSGKGAGLLLDRCPASRVEANALSARLWRHANPDAIAALITRRGTHVLLETDPEYPITETTPDRPPVLLA